jgi:hypothetical protein
LFVESVEAGMSEASTNLPGAFEDRTVALLM